MRDAKVTRRDALHAMAGGALWSVGRAASAAPEFYLATFTTDITPPLGEPLFGGLNAPALRINDPLYAKGFVLLGAAEPVVVVVVDFIEIRNVSHERWKHAIAEAAGTKPSRVLVTSLHIHNAPLDDVVAEKIIEEYGIKHKLCDPSYDDQCVQRAAEAVRQAVRTPKRVTHLGFGQARVDRVASNRRAVLPDGTVSFGRNSTTHNPAIRDAPEGLVDPYLKTLSFWDGNQPVAALSCYAVHPQTHFGKGDVTTDFTGLALKMRQQETPDVFQIYATGCGGDTTVGKYNDGDSKSIPLLADRLRVGMAAAWKDTQKQSLTSLGWRSVLLNFKMNEKDDLSEAAAKRTLSEKSQKYNECFRAACGLSWRRWVADGHSIEIPMADFGAVKLVLAPAETFVQYQLWAQELRPDSFVMVMAYGECSPGYLPTKIAVAEGWYDYYWEWADPESAEDALLPALADVLRKS